MTVSFRSVTTLRPFAFSLSIHATAATLKPISLSTTKILVLDLATGKELYRTQFVTKTGRRSAQISPDGHLLALNDGEEITLQTLP